MAGYQPQFEILLLALAIGRIIAREGGEEFVAVIEVEQQVGNIARIAVAHFGIGARRHDIDDVGDIGVDLGADEMRVAIDGFLEPAGVLVAPGSEHARAVRLRAFGFRALIGIGQQQLEIIVGLEQQLVARREGALEIVKKIKRDNFKFLTWLPLSHSYEHTIQFVQIAVGAKIYYSTKIEQLLENIKLAKPDIMTAVPRFYNNLYNKMNTGALKASSIKKWLFFQTVKIGSKIFLGKSISFKEKLTNILVDILVRKKVNKNFGGNLKAFVSGGGPLDSNVGIFLNALGLKTLQGYGLTETSPVVTCNPINKIKIDTVGLPLKNVKVKIASDGEILVKGENVMLGYWKNENATQEILKDQWLYTGDIGEIDNDGYLKITDRKKDIIVSSGGDNISPSKIENLLCLNNEIEQAYVHGDNEKYLSCLLVLNKNLEINNEQIKIIIENVNKNLTIVEKIKKFHVIDEEFTIENDLMTPTMKIKRHKIKDKYKNILENFYKKN